jgi:hypothetical protein
LSWDNYQGTRLVIDTRQPFAVQALTFRIRTLLTEVGNALEHRPHIYRPR